MDIKALAENLGLEEEEYMELLELFLETAAADLEKLEGALEEADADLVSSTAHSLKGSSGNMGFSAFSETARAMEMRGKEKRLDGSAEELDMLKAELAKIKELAGK
ncbi:MAG: Hpt domain-containing protein [Deltaproteobacteria bacterium]|nr:Hpt domain-containing protein [Deltaproteobacteria bacterium]MBW1923814.1 Hpt domain-containing protein [Deltaproteobacteria bacterium]MBW1948531.1 Hpt domain-containing protein [Deltaproteobacteria bacterium]MBW2006959.1 Hpt domain-containing protein [Deltaproteobacteria bacterium]MBW2103185.1 Hpt domain-containing protein [Deltaproteobacteria bacterium]